MLHFEKYSDTTSEVISESPEKEKLMKQDFTSDKPVENHKIYKPLIILK